MKGDPRRFTDDMEIVVVKKAVPKGKIESGFKSGKTPEDMRKKPK